jgi:aminoglycoside phosphotransferase (APT) family kinase protein
VNIAHARGLTDGMKAAAAAALEGLPDGETLCHGDFHPGNVIMTSEPVIIDWLDATRGHPLGDVARTSLLVKHAEVPGPSHLGAAILSLRAAFHAGYIRRYAETRPIDAGALEAWTLPVAAARLAEPVSAAEQEILVSLVERALARA